MKKITTLESRLIPFEQLQANTGQVPGLPSNPRRISKEKLKKLRRSIKKDPDMLSLREILVYPYAGQYVVIGGNQRLQALDGMGCTDVPCKVIPENATSVQLRAYLIKDNVEFGYWVDDMLTADWDLGELSDMGMDDVQDLELPEQPQPYTLPQQPQSSAPIPPAESNESVEPHVNYSDPIAESHRDEEQPAEPEHIVVNVPQEPVVDELPLPEHPIAPENTPAHVDDVPDDTSESQQSEQPDAASAIRQEVSRVQRLIIGELQIPLSTAEAESLIRKANSYQSEHRTCCGLFVEMLK